MLPGGGAGGRGRRASVRIAEMFDSEPAQTTDALQCVPKQAGGLDQRELGHWLPSPPFVQSFQPLEKRRLSSAFQSKTSECCCTENVLNWIFPCDETGNRQACNVRVTNVTEFWE